MRDHIKLCSKTCPPACTLRPALADKPAITDKSVRQDSIVEIQGVWFGYDAARPVLRDINLAVPRGAVVGIMGQSGCGKTTLLRIIAAAFLPTRGTARVLGRSTLGLGRDGF